MTTWRDLTNRLRSAVQQWARGTDRRVLAAAVVLAVITGVAWKGTGYTYAAPVADAATDAPVDRTLAAQLRRARAQVVRAEPKGPYIVVDRTHNQLFFKTPQETILNALCSVGSGASLAEPGTEREWTFATPRGHFRVLSKLKNPVWKKPDWAFIEEGEPIPSDPGERFEYGTMGEYGLYFGDGYLIHGTLYERLLGRSVSHGCVRLGRDDLRALYAATRVGTSIYIF